MQQKRRKESGNQRKVVVFFFRKPFDLCGLFDFTYLSPSMLQTLCHESSSGHDTLTAMDIKKSEWDRLRWWEWGDGVPVRGGQFPSKDTKQV